MDLEVTTRPLQAEPLRGLAILVVDDSADFTAMMAVRLRKLGGQIEIADSGFKALESVKRSKFDIILMDIQMPGLDGLKTIKMMRDLGVNTPVITLTALKDIVKLSRQQTAEIAAHAGKPPNIPDLVETIKGVIAIRDF